MDGSPITAGGPQVGDVLDRRYRLDERIGEGATALVFRATHVLIGRRLAVKTLRPEVARDGGLVERFLQEARCASAIKHPNVVELSDFGQLPDGGAFYVMEFLEGRTLAQEIDVVGPLPPERTIEIALQICCGLEAVHAAGIVHRDLKAENVFLVEGRGPEGTALAKLLDFGIARAPGGRMTAAGAILGTPEYMSPEQALGREVDPRSDLYGLGVMLFEMLTGLVPFASTDVVAVIEAQARRDPPTLASVRPELAALEQTQQVLSALLRKEPRDRPATAAEARERLDAALAADLGAETAQRVRSTLVIGSGALETSASPAEVAEGPMGWKAPGDPEPRRRARSTVSVPMVLSGTALASAAISLLGYAAVAGSGRSERTERLRPVLEPVEVRTLAAHASDSAEVAWKAPLHVAAPRRAEAPASEITAAARVEDPAAAPRRSSKRPRPRRTDREPGGVSPTPPPSPEPPGSEPVADPPSHARSTRPASNAEPTDLRDPFEEN